MLLSSFPIFETIYLVLSHSHSRRFQSWIDLSFSYLKNPWEEEHVFSVELTIMFKRVLGLPGFGPAANLLFFQEKLMVWTLLLKGCGGILAATTL